MNTEGITASINFFVPGDPKGQPRPRAFSFNGKARMYDPSTAEGWKGSIANALREACGTCDFGRHPVEVVLDFRFSRPKKHFRTGKHADEMRLDAPKFHASKPDIDNLFKAVTDALTELRVWHDDSQIVKCRCSKTYGLHPGCWVAIHRVIETPIEADEAETVLIKRRVEK